MSELPEGWAVAPLADVVTLQGNGISFQQGWSPQCESRPGDVDEWAVLKTTAIQHGEFWPHENKALPEHLDPRPQIEVKAGDVLMTCAGPRSRCGVACMVTDTRPKLMMSGKMYRFRPHPETLDPSFLSVFPRKHDTQQRIDEMKTGINDSGLNLTHDRFARLPIVVPPLGEQRPIVERVEALFAEVDVGVRSLETARRALGLYRRSLLKASFEGRLTAEWRAANPDLLETPDALLARIRKERETRHANALAGWEKAVATWDAGGREGKKPGKPQRSKMSKLSGYDDELADGFCTTLRDDGVGYGDYLEQLTYLIFLKMADEYARPPHNRDMGVPAGYDWASLTARRGADLEAHYIALLRELGTRPGMLGQIFTKAQLKIQDPAKLRRLVDLVDGETWVQLDADVKGDIYEDLLERNAADTKSGAAQYFTPRALIEAMVNCVRPEPLRTIADPACGTGGFFLAAYDHLAARGLDREEVRFLRPL